MRSADEPMTTFFHCVNCDNRWKNWLNNLNMMINIDELILFSNIWVKIIMNKKESS